MRLCTKLKEAGCKKSEFVSSKKKHANDRWFYLRVFFYHRLNVCFHVMAGSLVAAVGNFGETMDNFWCSNWKKCHNTQRQLLVRVS